MALLRILLVAVACVGFCAEGIEDAAWQQRFADHMVRAWEAGEPVPQLSAAHPEATLADGYRVQEAFVERAYGVEGIGGYKAAGVSASSRGRRGTESPLTGVMPADGILWVEDNVVLDLGEDPPRHVETEIGYLFDRAVTEPLPDVHTLREHVKEVAPIIELPGYASEEVKPSEPADLVSRNINAKAMIVGPRHDPDSVDLDAVEITLYHNGEVAKTARGDEAAGGQWSTLLKTVNDVVGRGFAVEPGHVITNGALGKILPAEPGHYKADFGTLGVIEFEAKAATAADPRE